MNNTSPHPSPVVLPLWFFTIGHCLVLPAMGYKTTTLNKETGNTPPHRVSAGMRAIPACTTESSSCTVYCTVYCTPLSGLSLSIAGGIEIYPHHTWNTASTTPSWAKRSRNSYLSSLFPFYSPFFYRLPLYTWSLFQSRWFHSHSFV